MFEMKTGWLKQGAAQLMNNCLQSLPDEGRLLEIGTGVAESTEFFSERKPNWFIYTIDSFGLSGDGRIYKQYSAEEIKPVFERIQGRRIVQILGDSTKIHWDPDLSLDVLYIDGGHYYECCKKDFETFAPHVKKDGFIFFHDYNREDFGVKQVVDEALSSGDFHAIHLGKEPAIELAILKVL